MYFRKDISPSFPHSCQEVLLDSMTLGPNIAKNAALQENVFMMAICIELRIPLFVVGKPGSSKSLAKSIVQSSMQGTASNSKLLRGFKQASNMTNGKLMHLYNGMGNYLITVIFKPGIIVIVSILIGFSNRTSRQLSVII